MAVRHWRNQGKTAARSEGDGLSSESFQRSEWAEIRPEPPWNSTLEFRDTTLPQINDSLTYEKVVRLAFGPFVLSLVCHPAQASAPAKSLKAEKLKPACLSELSN